MMFRGVDMELKLDLIIELLEKIYALHFFFVIAVICVFVLFMVFYPIFKLSMGKW